MPKKKKNKTYEEGKPLKRVGGRQLGHHVWQMVSLPQVFTPVTRLRHIACRTKPVPS